jgi:hypothetical protein
MVITWNTRLKTNVSTVQYGLRFPNTPVKGNMVMLGGPYGILQDVQFVHKVKLTGLKPGVRYGKQRRWQFSVRGDGSKKGSKN